MIRIPFMKKACYKKLIIAMALGAAMLLLASCGKKDDKTTETTTTTQNSTEDTATTDVATKEDAIELTAREELDYIKGKISFLYLPNMDIDAETFNAVFDLSSDMYEDFVCEMPMISTQSDMIAVVKPTEEAYAEVLAKLQAYMKMLQEDAMQYPMNAIQLKATQVYEKGGYIFYIALFGDMNEVMHDEEAVLKTCEANVAEVISIIDEQ
ncbi:MAG: DUF4358 domain-containing protein [Wujia sp.]